MCWFSNNENLSDTDPVIILRSQNLMDHWGTRFLPWRLEWSSLLFTWAWRRMWEFQSIKFWLIEYLWFIRKNSFLSANISMVSHPKLIYRYLSIGISITQQYLHHSQPSRPLTYILYDEFTGKTYWILVYDKQATLPMLLFLNWIWIMFKFIEKTIIRFPSVAVCFLELQCLPATKHVIKLVEFLDL